MAWPTTPVVVETQPTVAGPYGVPRSIFVFGPNASASGSSGGGGGATPPPSVNQLFPRGKA